MDRVERSDTRPTRLAPNDPGRRVRPPAWAEPHSTAVAYTGASLKLRLATIVVRMLSV